MNIFLTNTAFYTVSPDSLDQLTSDEKEEVRDFVSNSIVNGFVKPLPRIVYSSNEIEKLAKNKKHGGNRTRTLLTAEFFKTDVQRLKINPENSYVIFGE